MLTLPAKNHSLIKMVYWLAIFIQNANRVNTSRRILEGSSKLRVVLKVLESNIYP